MDAVRDGYVYYHIGQYHGWECFRTHAADVEAHHAVAVQDLSTDNGTIVRGPWVLPAFKRWEEGGGDAIDLLRAIHKGRDALIIERTGSVADVLQMAALDARYFELIYSKAQQYSLNIAFELVFFIAFAGIMLWPWLRRQGGWACACHLAAAPFLFFLPYYCGYGIWACTTYYGDGGIIYTWLIRWFRWQPTGAHRDLEQFLDIDLPDPQAISDALVPLNQLYDSDFMGPFAYGGPPPMVTLLMGVVLLAAIAAARFVLADVRLRRRYKLKEVKCRQSTFTRT